MSTDAATEALARLRRASQHRVERDGLLRHLAAADERRIAAAERVLVAERALGAEQRDVEAFDRVSFTKVWASLRGTADDDRQREQRELEAAQYALAEAQDLLQSETAQYAQVTERIAALGDVDVEVRDARAAREAELRAGAGAVGAADAGVLDRIAQERGRVDAVMTELVQAMDASRFAQERLNDAAAELSEAQSWATYDTFFGGGILADIAKHRRMDRASELLRRADRALAELAGELADVGIGAVGELRVDELSQLFDVWFDNFFADWAVRDRVIAAAEKVAGLQRAVAQVQTLLSQRRQEEERRSAALDAEYERALLGA